jgi:hypothetical protein
VVTRFLTGRALPRHEAPLTNVINRQEVVWRFDRRSNDDERVPDRRSSHRQPDNPGIFKALPRLNDRGGLRCVRQVLDGAVAAGNHRDGYGGHPVLLSTCPTVEPAVLDCDPGGGGQPDYDVLILSSSENGTPPAFSRR